MRKALVGLLIGHVDLHTMSATRRANSHATSQAAIRFASMSMRVRVYTVPGSPEQTVPADVLLTVVVALATRGGRLSQTDHC